MDRTKLTQAPNSCGTFFAFCINTRPNDLIDAFGEPYYSDSNVSEKASIEWALETADGVVFTIYDWKEYDNPALHNMDKMYEFHVGIKNKKHLSQVRQILDEYGFIR